MFQYRHKIALASLSVFIFPITILFTLYLVNLYNAEKGNRIQAISASLDAGTVSLNKLFAKNETKIYMINTNQDLASYITLNGDTRFPIVYDLLKNIQSMMSALNYESPDISSRVYVMNEIYGSTESVQYIEYFYRSVTPEDGGLIAQIEEMDDKTTLWVVRSVNSKHGARLEKDEYLCAYKKKMFFNRMTALIEVKIPISEISSYFRDAIPEGSFICMYLPNREPIILLQNAGAQAAPDVLAAGTGKAAGGYIAISSQYTAGPCGISLFAPESYINGRLNDLLIRGILILAAAIMIIFALIETVAYFITRKLTGLVAKIEGNLEETLQREDLSADGSKDEIDKLGDRFNQLVIRTKQYYDELHRYEIERKGLEFELLQSRINPHFLYNTLDTLKWTINNEKLSEVIDSLVRYYRIVLNKGDNIIAIELELIMLHEYVKLHIFAYEADIRYEMDIQPELLKRKIVRGLLQPILENALIHGLNGLRRAGLLKLTGRMEDRLIIFEVCDNGYGMSPEKIESVMDGLSLASTGGYGIYSVIKRIHILYGEQYGVSIESVQDQYTKVIVRIPVLDE